jgi:hypothetical protein
MGVIDMDAVFPLEGLDQKGRAGGATDHDALHAAYALAARAEIVQ